MKHFVVVAVDVVVMLKEMTAKKKNYCFVVHCFVVVVVVYVAVVAPTGLAIFC